MGAVLTPQGSELPCPCPGSFVESPKPSTSLVASLLHSASAFRDLTVLGMDLPGLQEHMEPRDAGGNLDK